MEKPIKVLDLFAGTQSVKKSLSKMFNIVYWENINGMWKGYDTSLHDYCIVEYIGLDIYSPEDENIILDLSRKDIITKMKELELTGWKPDFIWASPTCNKVSAAVTGKGGNAYFIVENGSLRPRKKEEYHIVKHNGINKRPEMWDQYIADAELALSLHKNTNKIIKYFNVPFVIENPYTSLAKYIYKELIRNKAEYCGYGFEYKKATAFYTNKQINLKTHNKEDNHRCLRFDRINRTDKWPSHWNKNISTYANRSSVPPKLIIDIIKQILGGQNV